MQEEELSRHHSNAIVPSFVHGERTIERGAGDPERLADIVNRHTFVRVHRLRHLHTRRLHRKRFVSALTSTRTGSGQARAGSFLNEASLTLDQRAHSNSK